MVSSLTPIRPFVELARQISGKIVCKYYMICDNSLDYERFVSDNQLECKNVFFIGVGKKSGKSCSVAERKREKKEKVRELVYKSMALLRFGVDIKNIFQIINNEQKKRNEIEKIFDLYKPNLLICYSDLRLGYEMHAIYCAAKLGITRMIAPIVKYGTAESLLCSPESFYVKKVCERLSFLEKYAIKKYPMCAINVKDMIAFRFSPQTIIALGYMGLLPENLWIPGSGDITQAALISDSEYQYYLKIMGDEYRQKCKVTHTIEETYIIQKMKDRVELKREILSKYNVSVDSIVCLALSSHANSTSNITYEEEKNVYLKIIASLKSVFGNIFISMHPRMIKENYLWISEIENCILLDEPLYKIIPIIDVFCAGEYSSVTDMVKNINFPKIYYSMDIFREDKLYVELKKIQDESEKIKKMDRQTIYYQYDGKSDFVDMVIEEITKNEKNKPTY